jgi:hypothetical protein
VTNATRPERDMVSDLLKLRKRNYSWAALAMWLQ